MKFSKIYILISSILLLASSCQNKNELLGKEGALSIFIRGYNGASTPLNIAIDTLIIPNAIGANYSFNQNRKYYVPNRKNLKMTITEAGTNKLVLEREISSEEYLINLNLYYINGQVYEKPTSPAPVLNHKQASFLFIPNVTQYTGDIDIVYAKRTEVIENGQFVFRSEETLSKVTAKPYVFSPFLNMPIFAQGIQVVNGERLVVNSYIYLYQAGTQIPYYDTIGFTISNSYITPPQEVVPMSVALIETGSTPNKRINSFSQIQF